MKVFLSMFTVVFMMKIQVWAGGQSTGNGGGSGEVETIYCDANGGHYLMIRSSKIETGYPADVLWFQKTPMTSESGVLSVHLSRELIEEFQKNPTSWGGEMFEEIKNIRIDMNGSVVEIKMKLDAHEGPGLLKFAATNEEVILDCTHTRRFGN